MSKWKRTPKVIEHSQIKDKNSHLLKKTIREDEFLHERERFENEDQDANVVSIELHKKLERHNHWVERNKLISFFHRHDAPHMPLSFYKMSIKIQFPSLDQTLLFLNDLENDINSGAIKSKGNFKYVANPAADKEMNVRLLRRLNILATFTPEMKNDILSWYFKDLNSEEARKFAQEVFASVENITEDAPVNIDTRAESVELPVVTLAQTVVEIPVEPTSIKIEETTQIQAEINNPEPVEAVTVTHQPIPVTEEKETQTKTAALSPIEVFANVEATHTETSEAKNVEDSVVNGKAEIEDVQKSPIISPKQEQAFEKSTTPPNSSSFFKSRTEEAVTPVEIVNKENSELGAERPLSPRL